MPLEKAPGAAPKRGMVVTAVLLPTEAPVDETPEPLWQLGPKPYGESYCQR